MRKARAIGLITVASAIVTVGSVASSLDRLVEVYRLGCSPQVLLVTSKPSTSPGSPLRFYEIEIEVTSTGRRLLQFVFDRKPEIVCGPTAVLEVLGSDGSPVEFDDWLDAEVSGRCVWEGPCSALPGSHDQCTRESSIAPGGIQRFSGRLVVCGVGGALEFQTTLRTPGGDPVAVRRSFDLPSP